MAPRMLGGPVSKGSFVPVMDNLEPYKFWPKLSLWIVSAPCCHFLRNKSNCAAQGLCQVTSNPMLRSHLQHLRCQVSRSSYEVFRIAQKSLSVVRVSGRTGLFLSYNKWKGPRAFPTSLKKVLKGKKKVTQCIPDASAKEFQGENESVYMENIGSSSSEFILNDFKANNSLIK